MWITVVVTVTKAHVNADDKPHAPDNLIYIHFTDHKITSTTTKEMHQKKREEDRNKERKKMKQWRKYISKWIDEQM